jgi:phospholipid transport system substrate-binding protein
LKKYLLVLSIWLFLPSFTPVQAPGPSAAIQADIDKVLEVLRDKNLSEKDKREKILAFYRQMFDEEELAKRTLGANWRKLNPAQQQEFSHLYRRVLERAYMNKILSYKDQRVVVTREVTFSKNLAEVFTKVITASQEVPINYRVILVDGTWKIYDVVIENVSLILNYRSQFDSILARDSPARMLEILRKKVEEK